MGKCTGKISGVRRGGFGGFEPPPEPEKIVVESDVISEVSIFSNKFSQKIVKNSIFPLNFHQRFSKIPKQLCFSSKRAKIDRMVLNFFAK